MAILQQHGFTVPCVGDGSSVTAVIDLYEYIAATPTLPKTPTALVLVQTDYPSASVTGVLNGTIVTLTHSVAVPANTSVTFTIVLGF